MTEWKTYKLRDIANITTGFPFKGDLYSKNGIRVLRGENIGDEELRWDGHRDKRWNLPFERINEYLLQDGDVILAMDGNVGKNKARITDKDLPMLIAQRVACIRANTLSDQKFLYYAIISRAFQQYLDSVKTGTTIQHISMKQIADYEISLPGLEEQRRIAGILGAIDDKIENNRRINSNLELQAQTLYKQWFVDNRKDDWEIKSLSDLMDYQGGSQPPASEFIDKPQDGYVRFVQIRDYASNSHPTYIPIAKKNKLCNKKDIMIARYGASLGRICFGLEGAYNVALAKVKPLENYYREFLRCYLSSNEFYDGINMKGNRAVQAGFNQSDINSFMISCPKQDIFVAFENIVSKILDKRLVLQQENETLATLRDTLLPKLMNGEIKM